MSDCKQKGLAVLTAGSMSLKSVTYATRMSAFSNPALFIVFYSALISLHLTSFTNIVAYEFLPKTMVQPQII